MKLFGRVTLISYFCGERGREGGTELLCNVEKTPALQQSHVVFIYWYTEQH